MRKKTQLLNLIILTLLATCLAACAANQGLAASQPLAVDGVLDLREWDFEKGGLVNLNGQWEFYWGQLLTDNNFTGGNPSTITGFIKVPSPWNGYPVKGNPISGEGYATYRLRVLINPNHFPEDFWAIKTPIPLNTAYRFYINGKLIAKAGQVGTTAQTSAPEYAPDVYTFAPQSNQLEILIQVSNFQHAQGGITVDRILLGPQSQVYGFNQQQAWRDLFLIGASFIIGLYHLGLFLLLRRERSILFFGIFCLLTAINTLILRQPQLFAAYGNQSWGAYIQIRILLTMSAATMLVLFVESLFPSMARQPIRKIIVGIWFVLVSLPMILPTSLSTALLPIFSLFGTLLGLYNLVIILAAVNRKTNRAVILLMGYIPFLLTNLNDVLYVNGLVQTGSLVAVGVFILILAQAYLLAADYSNSYNQIKSLSDDLQANFDSLQNAQDGLRLSEARYRSIFEDSKDLIFLTALDGRMEAINSASFGLLGYTRDEAMRLNALDFYINPEERRRFQEAIAPTGSVTDFPVRLRHKDGHELACQITAIVRLDKTDQPIGYQGIVHDLTAYQQAEAARQRVWALQDLNQSLEERVEARTLALSEANTALQVEIEQRQSQQQEKERLLALAHQQSEHLRSMSRWLVEMQKPHRAALLDEDIQQKMDDIRRNLTLLQGIPGFEQNPSLITYVSDTIRLLAEVEIYVEQVSTSLDETESTGDPLTGNPLLQLSSRERQVLKLTAEGKSNPEIADILTIRLNTVHTYLKRIRHKLDIQDMQGLVKFARENKIIQ